MRRRLKGRVSKLGEQLRRLYDHVTGRGLATGARDMIISFRPEKAVQAAGALFRGQGTGRMSRLRFLKLLYIADRESLTQRGRPITGDRVAAMGHGPVLGSTYDLINGEGKGATLWKHFFRTDGRDLELVCNPDVGELSRFELSKLLEVGARFKSHPDAALRRITHEFPEYLKHEPKDGKKRNFIPAADILNAVGHGSRKEQILSDGVAEEKAHRLLSDLHGMLAVHEVPDDNPASP